VTIRDWAKRLRGSLSGIRRRTAVAAPAPKEESAQTALLREAIECHTAGDLDGAQAIYRSLLDGDPDFVPALHLLGNAYGQQEMLDKASEYLQRALSLSPGDPDIQLDLANVRRLEERFDAAESLLRDAIVSAPERAECHYALAQIFIARGDHPAAIDSLKRTIALGEDHAGAHNDLGAALLHMGRYEPARRALQAAARLDPDSPAAQINLAELHTRLGEPAPAAKYYRRVIELSPDDNVARERLGGLLLEIGEGDAALDCYKALAERNADDAQVFRRLAEAAVRLNLPSQAIAWYRRSLEIDPRQPETCNNFGVLLRSTGRCEEAVKNLKAAISLSPDLDQAFHNLGNTYHLQGRYDEAVEAYQSALEIAPFDSTTISNLIGICNYRVQKDPDFVARLHARYRRALAPERARATTAHGNDRCTDRRLRVGYVSPDFRQHSVAYFIEPVIVGHDRRRFEVYCYSDVARPDNLTRALETIADQWRDISGQDDDAVVSQIREDEIDILVDLDGHCADNRLPVFAQKPAPVQVTYLGYPATTGLPEMDYRLTDSVADPADAQDQWYSEGLVRIAGTFLCYRPPETAPPVSASSNEPQAVTFGSFSELSKVSPEVVRAWARILQEVAGSNLFLKSAALGDPSTKQRVKAWFEEVGIAPARIELLGRTDSLEEHLALYQRVDVALDTFPYNGTTTTCEALYMGVPVITLRGATHAGRVGATLLSAMALDGYIAPSEDAYVRAAVSLAGDPEKRAQLRNMLRNRLLGSTLTDARAFVTELDSIYLRLWARWRDRV
jgi:predicted O-linked N-acetylglucosamine transferase (SPINDLY family)